MWTPACTDTMNLGPQKDSTNADTSFPRDAVVRAGEKGAMFFEVQRTAKANLIPVPRYSVEDGHPSEGFVNDPPPPRTQTGKIAKRRKKLSGEERNRPQGGQGGRSRTGSDGARSTSGLVSDRCAAGRDA